MSVFDEALDVLCHGLYQLRLDRRGVMRRVYQVQRRRVVVVDVNDHVSGRTKRVRSIARIFLNLPVILAGGEVCVFCVVIHVQH